MTPDLLAHLARQPGRCRLCGWHITLMGHHPNLHDRKGDMNRQTLPGMIRDLLRTGDQESRVKNFEWLVSVLNRHAPAGLSVVVREKVEA